jgi:hypothetical protein
MIATPTAAYSRAHAVAARTHRLRLIPISPDSHSAASTIAGHVIAVVCGGM